MEYKYIENDDFSFLASGNVIKHFSGMPCFPVRLSLELFERAYHLLGKDKITMYDPCCGNGFSLTVVGMIEQSKLLALYGSDVDSRCVEAAACNLALTEREGLIKSRDTLLRNDITDSRREQLCYSVERLLTGFTDGSIDRLVFHNDILAASPELPCPIDYVFADIPYGNLTNWQVTGVESPDIINRLLDNLSSILSDNGILVICGDKSLRVASERFERIEKIRAGKRLVYILRKIT